jgi:hypothetical protein
LLFGAVLRISRLILGIVLRVVTRLILGICLLVGFVFVHKKYPFLAFCGTKVFLPRKDIFIH